MKIQGKIWGKTQEIFKNSNFELHRIEAKKGGFSSIHKHAYKFNAFYVEKGSIKITIYENDYDLIDETLISTGELSIVKPGNFHKFEALEDTICYEIYWVELNFDDIERKNVGGIN
jgi:quercetin dioxygenase-like cupin family protein